MTFPLVFASMTGTPPDPSHVRRAFRTAIRDAHSSTAVTELVYRKQIRPVLQAGAVAMDRIFTD